MRPRRARRRETTRQRASPRQERFCLSSGPEIPRERQRKITMTQQGTILVTGGAGYIGSHTVLQLRARGERVVVLDNLYTGFRQSVLDTPLVVGNVGDCDTVLETLRKHGVNTVMHFAAHTIVPESVAEPLKYYGNNTCGTR